MHKKNKQKDWLKILNRLIKVKLINLDKNKWKWK